MISIITCSRYENVTLEFRENISKTIGCDYELIVINNAKKKYGITSAYNEGVNRSVGDILCFIHDDIVFISSNWGEIITNKIKNNRKIGLLGVAGGHYLPKEPCSWSDSGLTSANLIQGGYENGSYREFLDIRCAYRQTDTNVAAVDGVFMCMPKSLFKIIKWDDRVFREFHFYDLDMSMQVWQAGYEVQVLFDVLILHKSPGVANESYYRSRAIWFEKWKNILPLVKGVELSETEMEARSMLVRERNEFREKYLSITNSKSYILGRHLLYPIKVIRKHIKRIFINREIK